MSSVTYTVLVMFETNCTLSIENDCCAKCKVFIRYQEKEIHKHLTSLFLEKNNELQNSTLLIYSNCLVTCISSYKCVHISYVVFYHFFGEKYAINTWDHVSYGKPRLPY